MPEQVARCNWVNQIGVQCGMPYGHIGNHGNGLLTTPRDEWHEFIGANDPIFPIKQVERVGTVWTEKSVIKRCLWSGVRSRCIYELGHTLPHKEEENVRHAD